MFISNDLSRLAFMFKGGGHVSTQQFQDGKILTS